MSEIAPGTSFGPYEILSHLKSGWGITILGHSHPVVFKTKRAAIVALDAWIDALWERARRRERG